jgi:hypothetical protein
MPSNPFTDPQWATRTVDAIERIVAFVRDRTTRPAVAIVRGNSRIAFTARHLVVARHRSVGVLFNHWWRILCHWHVVDAPPPSARLNSIQQKRNPL